MNSESIFPKMPSVRTAKVFLVIAIFTGILSGTSGGQILCTMVSAVAGTIALLSLPRPSIGRIIRNALLMGLVCLICAGAVGYFVTGRLLFSSVGALPPALCTLAVCLSVYKLRSRSFTVTFAGLILFLMLALIILANRYDSVGSLSIASLKKMLTEFESSLVTALRDMLESLTGSDPKLMPSDAELLRSIRITECILPFIIYDICILCAYIITGVVRRILLGYTLGRRSLIGWLLIPSRVSCVLYLIAMPVFIFTMSFLVIDGSLLNPGSILSLASIAILLLTLPACFAIGVRRTLFLYRTRRRFGFAGILCALLVGMLFPPILLFYFGFAGAYHTIFDPIIAKKLENMNRSGNGDSPNPG